MSTNSTSKEYVLTTSQTEDDRLKRQHDLWLEDTLSLWKRAGLHGKQNILELGCGPGYSTLDLARYLGPTCDITAIELSPNFSQESAKRLRDYPQVRVINEDLHQIDLPKDTFDACYGRWIFMFLPKPEEALKKIIRSLKPGGMLILQEYVDYQAMNLVPSPPIFKKTVDCIIKSFSDAGGDGDIMRKLPLMVNGLGMRVEVLESRGKLIRPQEPFWDWPTQFYQSYLPTLQSKGLLQKNEVEEFHAEWAKAAKTPGSFFIAPTVAHLIARKINY